MEALVCIASFYVFIPVFFVVELSTLPTFGYDLLWRWGNLVVSWWGLTLLLPFVPFPTFFAPWPASSAMWFAASGTEGFLSVECIGCGVFVEACFVLGIFLNISGVQVWSGCVCMFFLVVFPLLPPSWGGGRRLFLPFVCFFIVVP